MRLLHAVAMTWRQMRGARAEGAPWPMVRFYMRAEFRHALRGHAGHAQDCAPCYIAIARIPGDVP